MTNEKQYSEKIAALIKQFLDKDEWKYTFYEEDGVFTFGELIDGAIKTNPLQSICPPGRLYCKCFC